MSQLLRTFFKISVLIILGSIVAFSAGELFLRHRGLNLSCYKKADREFAQAADFMKPASRACGWGYQANTKRFGKVTAGSVTMNTGPDGLRVSRPDFNKQGRYKIAFFGCSYLFGIGVSDPETMPYILNRKCPDTVFDNYGVCFYGTYQSYMVMEHVLANKHYDAAVYCFCRPHVSRNVDFRLVGDLSRGKMYCQAPIVCRSSSGRNWFLFDAQNLEWPFQRRSVLIDFLHADHPESMNPAYQVSSTDNHPIGAVHEYWARKFFPWLKDKGFVNSASKWTD